MKKIIKVLAMCLFLVSCSIMPKTIIVTNSTINAKASQKINISKNIIIAKLSVTNQKTVAVDGHIESTLRYKYDILGGVVASNFGTVKVKTDLIVKNNKLYLHNPEVLNITANNGLKENEKIANAISDVILNTLSLSEVYDFKNDYYVKDVKIYNNMIILNLE